MPLWHKYKRTKEARQQRAAETQRRREQEQQAAEEWDQYCKRGVAPYF
jgi:hypothetical protein